MATTMISANTTAAVTTTGSRARRANVRACATRRVTTSKVKVAINGFGRIGRNFLRCLEGRDSTDL